MLKNGLTWFNKRPRQATRPSGLRRRRGNRIWTRNRENEKRGAPIWAPAVRPPGPGGRTVGPHLGAPRFAMRARAGTRRAKLIKQQARARWWLRVLPATCPATCTRPGPRGAPKHDGGAPCVCLTHVKRTNIAPRPCWRAPRRLLAGAPRERLLTAAGGLGAGCWQELRGAAQGQFQPHSNLF